MTRKQDPDHSRMRQQLSNFLNGNSPSETDRTCKLGAETDSLGESSPTEWLMFQCMLLDFLDSFGCATIAGLRWPGPETIDGGPQ